MGFYGTLVNVNAYHQPGAEAGKKAATELLRLQEMVRGVLTATPQTAGELASALNAEPESVFHILDHLNANDAHVKRKWKINPGEDRFFRL